MHLVNILYIAPKLDFLKLLKKNIWGFSPNHPADWLTHFACYANCLTILISHPDITQVSSEKKYNIYRYMLQMNIKYENIEYKNKKEYVSGRAL